MFVALWIYATPTENARSTATLLFAGDAMCHQAQLDAARKGTEYCFSGYYKHIEHIVRRADYAVVNLETPTAGAPYSGYPCFNAPDSFAEELKKCGFDMLLTANNHTLDRRSRGANKTIKLLDSLQIDHIGTYESDDARRKIMPFVKDINGFRIGFLNYTYGTNGITADGNFTVDYINRDKIAADVASARKAGAELIVAALHWGTEYKLYPDNFQKSLAKYLSELGVEMIIGSHPHVVQPMELKDGKLTVFSLGNLISNMKTTDTRGGAILRVTLERDLSGKAMVRDAAYSLVFVEPPTDRKDNFKIIPCENAEKAATKTRCEAFLNSTGKILKNKNIGVRYVPMDSLMPQTSLPEFSLPFFAPIINEQF